MTIGLPDPPNLPPVENVGILRFPVSLVKGVTVTNSGLEPSPIRTPLKVVRVFTIRLKPCYTCTINELRCLKFF